VKDMRSCSMNYVMKQGLEVKLSEATLRTKAIKRGINLRLQIIPGTLSILIVNGDLLTLPGQLAGPMRAEW
jgi:hypothetical protein